LGEESADFVPGEDNRDAFGFFGARQVVKPVERLSENGSVEEEERGESLVLSGTCDLVVDGEMGEE